MAKQLLLKANKRESLGTKAAAMLRRGGRLPAVVYGHKREPVPVWLDAHEFSEGLHHGHRLMEIQLGRTREKIIVKDLQYDHLGKNIIHADLVRVDITETVRLQVPIELKGTPKGSHEGGIIAEHLDHLDIECTASDIPETIVVSIKEMVVGDSIHAGEIELPKGVKLIGDPSSLVISCSLVTTAKTTEQVEAETPAVPEVIGAEEAADADQQKEPQDRK